MALTYLLVLAFTFGQYQAAVPGHVKCTTEYGKCSEWTGVDWVHHSDTYAFLTHKTVLSIETITPAGFSYEECDTKTITLDPEQCTVYENTGAPPPQHRPRPRSNSIAARTVSATSRNDECATAVHCRSTYFIGETHLETRVETSTAQCPTVTVSRTDTVEFCATQTVVPTVTIDVTAVPTVEVTMNNSNLPSVTACFALRTGTDYIALPSEAGLRRSAQPSASSDSADIFTLSEGHWYRYHDGYYMSQSESDWVRGGGGRTQVFFNDPLFTKQEWEVIPPTTCAIAPGSNSFTCANGDRTVFQTCEFDMGTRALGLDTDVTWKHQSCRPLALTAEARDCPTHFSPVCFVLKVALADIMPQIRGRYLVIDAAGGSSPTVGLGSLEDASIWNMYNRFPGFWKFQPLKTSASQLSTRMEETSNQRALIYFAEPPDGNEHLTCSIAPGTQWFECMGQFEGAGKMVMQYCNGTGGHRPFIGIDFRVNDGCVAVLLTAESRQPCLGNVS